MNIWLIGSKGFVGSAVMRKLSCSHKVFGVSSKDKFGCGSFENTDFVVNCAGNSKRWLVESDPTEALWNEKKIMELITKIISESPKAKIIHISSVCAGDETPYGDLKLQMEDYIYDFDYWCVLRLVGLVGENLRKNVIFDWIHGRSIRVSPYSVYNFISTAEVAGVVEYLINNWKEGMILNVGASESILLQDIFKLRKGVTPFFMPGDLPCEVYNIDVSELQKFYSVKTSKEYLEEFLNGQVA